MTEPGKISDQTKALLYAEEFHLLDDDLGRTVEEILSLGIDDEFLQETLHHRINSHAFNRARYGPFEHPRFQGNFFQGVGWKNRQPITYPVEKKLQHSLTVTMTGFGKTNAARIEILNLLDHVDSVVAIDVMKNEFACLAPLAKRIGHALPVISGHTLRINLLEIPEGVKTEVWAAALADVLVEALQLPPEATRLLSSCLLYVYQEHEKNNQSGNVKTFPTLLDLRGTVMSATHSNTSARQAILNRLDPLLQSLGKVFGYKKGWSTSDLFKRHLVLSLHDVTEIEKNLIISWLLLSVFVSAVSKGETNQGAKVLFVFDEASRILRSGSALASWFPYIRGAGIVVDMYTQYIADGAISHQIISNCPNKRLGKTGHPKDFDGMANAMSFDQHKKKWLQKNLDQPGHFAMQVSSLGAPFLYRVPLLRVPKPSPQKTGCSELDLLPVIPDEDMQQYQHQWGRTNVPRIATSPTQTQTASTNPTTVPLLNQKELRLLQAIGENQNQSVSFYVAQLGLGRGTEVKLRKILSAKKLICIKKVQTRKKSGRPPKLLALTVEGEAYLENIANGG